MKTIKNWLFLIFFGIIGFVLLSPGLAKQAMLELEEAGVGEADLLEIFSPGR